MFLKRHIEGVLWTAAIVLPFFAALVPSGFAVGSHSVWLTLLAVLWLMCLVVVIPLHFYRAWRQWPSVPNRRSYALWVGFETLATMALIGIVIYSAKH